MKMIEFLVFRANDDLKSELIRIMLSDNLRRGRIFVVTIILFESVLVLTNIVIALLKVDSSVQFGAYTIMYILMILINVVFFFLLPNQKTLETKSTKDLLKLENIMILYITLILCWGSVISLMDQKLYGQLMVFMVNMLVLSVVCQLEYKKLLLPYAISIIILAAGLPFFQPSGNVLFGHYINLAIFVIISWLASRMIYYNSCSNIQSGLLLKKSNIALEKQIEQNKLMNSRMVKTHLSLRTTISELKNAMEQVNLLSGMLPICSSCKKIRDDGGYWQQIESYISKHSAVEFSHSLCPECVNKLYPNLKDKNP